MNSYKKTNQPITPAFTQPVSGPNAIQLQDNRAKTILQKKTAENGNHTGLPDNLKTGVEQLSGYSMNDVKVHYNSSQPTQLQALAYAQGTNIHIAPGQEKHLPHEAWHVVQQKQGRVRPTLQMKNKININDDKGLEKEADVMGAKALSIPVLQNMTQTLSLKKAVSVIQKKGERTAVANTRIATRSAKEQIRRGNRRGSIIGTHGKSAAKLEITYIDKRSKKFNTGYRNKVQELEKYVIKRMVDSGHYTKGNATRLIENNHSFLQAKAVEEISVGNCGEFSMVVFADLVQNTTGQYVYRAEMHGKVSGSRDNFDHVFAFTYDQPINVDPGKTNVDNIDKNKAIIADAWDGYQIMTLRHFQNGGNAYRVRLTNDNIRLLEGRLATGTQVFSPEIQTYITDWARSFNADFETQMKNKHSTYAREARNEYNKPEGFDTDGTNVVGIRDLRTFEQQYQNSTDKEKKEIVREATNNDLVHALLNLTDQDKGKIIDLMDNRKLRDIMKSYPAAFKQLTRYFTDLKMASLISFLNEMNRKKLLSHLTDTILITVVSNYPSLCKKIGHLLSIERFIILLAGISDKGKRALFDLLSKQQLVKFILPIDPHTTAFLHALPDRRLAAALAPFEKKTKKKLLRLMTIPQRAYLFNQTPRGQYLQKLYNQ